MCNLALNPKMMELLADTGEVRGATFAIGETLKNDGLLVDKS